MRRQIWLAAILMTSLPAAASPTVKFVKWDKPHGGSRANVAALDLSTRKVLWEAHPGKSINFVAETKDGVLVGTDEGSLVLFNASDSKVV